MTRSSNSEPTGWVPSGHCAKVEAERDRYREALARIVHLYPLVRHPALEDARRIAREALND